jgi:hypothetical protein
MSGNISARIVAILGGVIVLIFGLILAELVIDTSVSALTHAAIGSFVGATAVGGLIPFLYFTAILGIAVGLMGVGFGGFLGRGPMSAFGLPVVALFTPYTLAAVAASLVVWYGVYYVQRHYSFRQQKSLVA